MVSLEVNGKRYDVDASPDIGGRDLGPRPR